MFEKNWCEIKGKRFLYSRPKRAVSDDDWIEFFEIELVNLEGDYFLLLVDSMGIEESVGFKLFSYLIGSLKKRNVCLVRIAVIPSNSLYEPLQKLFESLAGVNELDLKAQLFKRRGDAEAWLISQ